jgi:hypothetical protein
VATVVCGLRAALLKGNKLIAQVDESHRVTFAAQLSAPGCSATASRPRSRRRFVPSGGAEGRSKPPGCTVGAPFPKRGDQQAMQHPARTPSDARGSVEAIRVFSSARRSFSRS